MVIENKLKDFQIAMANGDYSKEIINEERELRNKWKEVVGREDIF